MDSHMALSWTGPRGEGSQEAGLETHIFKVFFILNTALEIRTLYHNFLQFKKKEKKDYPFHHLNNSCINVAQLSFSFFVIISTNIRIQSKL
jgi:hypothetical protein